MSRRVTIVLAAIGCLIAAAPRSARAQVFGLEGVYVPSSGARRASLGVGADFGYIVPVGPLGVWGAVGFEYQRQVHNGPGRGRESAELRLLPVREHWWLVPFAGGSVSANRSGGNLSEWPGLRTGLDALAGVLYLPDPTSLVALSIQERFGYIVRVPEHTLATEVGIRFRFQ